MRLPYAWADRAHAHTVFHESTLASGTVKAREITGFIRGSRRRASATDLLDRDAGGPAPLHEPVGVLRRVDRRRHEQATRVLDAVGGDPPEDHVLVDALL